MQKIRGQSTIEYMVLAIIILAAFLTMQVYIKRGISGRWKSVTDDLGDQYDPRLSDYSLRHSLLTNGVTRISTVASTNGTPGYYTMRLDQSSMLETKNGQTVTGN